MKPAQVKPVIDLEVVNQVDARVGTIESVSEVDGSNKLVRLTVDFGDHQADDLRGDETGARGSDRNRRSTGVVYRRSFAGSRLVCSRGRPQATERSHYRPWPAAEGLDQDGYGHPHPARTHQCAIPRSGGRSGRGPRHCCRMHERPGCTRALAQGEGRPESGRPAGAGCVVGASLHGRATSQAEGAPVPSAGRGENGKSGRGCRKCSPSVHSPGC